MKVVLQMLRRNMKLFFRDRSAVFFSLLSVFIIIGLFALFLKDTYSSMLIGQISNADEDTIGWFINTWIMAGMLAVTTLTTAMGVTGNMIDDVEKKISKDFYSAPIKKTQIATGYLLSAWCVSVIMSIVAFVVMEIYIVLSGGELLDLAGIVQTLGMIFISSFASTSIIFFVTCFISSSKAYSSASVVIGTLSGFLLGIYVPIGNLPVMAQNVIKAFPISHAAVALRQIFMEKPISELFGSIPSQELQEFMGITYYFGDYEITKPIMLAVLAATGIVFLFFSILVLAFGKKNRT